MLALDTVMTSKLIPRKLNEIIFCKRIKQKNVSVCVGASHVVGIFFWGGVKNKFSY